MGLIRAALRRPITVLVAVIAVALTAAFAVNRMRTDIFPDLDLPVIYVAQPYGGMSPAQMEGYITYYYEYHFLYINGIESVESKSVQNNALLKLTFHAGTDMAEALAQTISYVNRARAFMPPGTVGAFVMRLGRARCLSATWCSGATRAASAKFKIWRSTGSVPSSRRSPASRRLRRSVAASAPS